VLSFIVIVYRYRSLLEYRVAAYNCDGIYYLARTLPIVVSISRVKSDVP